VDDLGRGSGNPELKILGPSSWLFVDSVGYLWLSRLQTFVVRGYLGYLDVFVSVKSPNNHQLSVVTDDLGRWRVVAP
jgi:hypothetical protein